MEVVVKHKNLLSDAKECFAQEEKWGIKVEDMALCLTSEDWGTFAQDFVVIFKMKTSVSREAIIKAANAQEVTTASKLFYRTPDKNVIYFPSDKLIIVGNTEATLVKLLAKTEGKVTISESLKIAIRRSSGDFWEAEGDLNSHTKGSKPNASTERNTYEVKTYRISGERVRVMEEHDLGSTDEARKIIEQFEAKGKINFGKGVEFEGLSRSGSVITVRATEPVSSLFYVFPRRRERFERPKFDFQPPE
jgi:hypothetical protein